MFRSIRNIFRNFPKGRSKEKWRVDILSYHRFNSIIVASNYIERMDNLDRVSISIRVTIRGIRNLVSSLASIEGSTIRGREGVEIHR